MQEIVMEIYREMYRRANPSRDIDDVIKSGEGKKSQWFMKYYLPQAEQETILETICKNHKLTKYERYKLSIEVNLGCSPRGFVKQCMKS
jgi:hypothetical protein